MNDPGRENRGDAFVPQRHAAGQDPAADPRRPFAPTPVRSRAEVLSGVSKDETGVSPIDEALALQAAFDFTGHASSEDLFGVTPLPSSPVQEGRVEMIEVPEGFGSDDLRAEAATVGGETLQVGDGWLTHQTRLAIALARQGVRVTPFFVRGREIPPEARDGFEPTADEAEVLRWAKAYPGCGWSADGSGVRIAGKDFDGGGDVLDRRQFEERLRAAKLRQEANRLGLVWPGDADRHGVPKLSAAEWAAQDLRTEYLVEGFLAKGQPGFVAGPAKTGKTLFALALAIHGATGTPLFGDKDLTPARPFRTWLISMESGGPVLRDVARSVCESLGTSLKKLGDMLHVTAERTRINHPSALADVRRQVEAEKIDLLVIDPFGVAMMLPKEAMQNLSVMYDALGPFGELCEQTGCTVLFAHHTVKGKARTTSRTDLVDLNGAGVAEWARQWLLLSRRAAYDPGLDRGHHELYVNYGGSAGHSGGFELDLREFAPDGKRAWSSKVLLPRPETKTAKPDPALVKAEAEKRKREADTTEVLRVLGEAGTPLSAGAIRVKTSPMLKADVCKNLCYLLLREGLLVDAGRGHKGAELFALTAAGAEAAFDRTGVPARLPAADAAAASGDPRAEKTPTA